MRTNKDHWKWTAAFVALAVILCGVAANIALTLEVQSECMTLQDETPKDDHAKPSALPCAAIPTRFVSEQPDCVNRLLEAMNVTNLRIVSNLSQRPQLDERMEARLMRMAALRDEKMNTSSKLD